MPANLAYHGSAGDYFADHAENGTWNSLIDRPAIAALAGDVDGLRILDAGCGAGHHAVGLVERGASVLGLEGSAVLVEHARARLGDRAEIRQHDLNEPLSPADASFDGVLCALVLHHLADRPAFLREVFRVLRPGGWFILSTTHPTSDWRHFEDSYFSSEWVQLMMRDGVHAIRYQRMSIETIVTELLTAGFVLEQLVEPRPVEALRDLDPDSYHNLTRSPSLLALRLRRP
ncbi:class I SAM-dependent methyltransferase [Microlunatus soli]|uniref:Ubiquinone/menaquinone biosynthesis C-methylase UbiE n=1 Tax=Microlunatus soli TaxID=630515 RepID=A0A1H1W6C8_9ACTN|nr:class I SAM-dependent methyltransferase [Microlunatus soli]SDS92594.1 Ubiquinone/menaquinone biosynthesis C-methylase UbiE [Microlunatus soli]